MVERNNSCLAIESEVSANKSISKAFQVPTVSKKKNTIETNLCCVIEDSTNLQVNVPYTPIVTSNNKNNVCVINNDIQSNVETNNDELDNESLLIDYEASDSEELSFSHTLETIDNDIDICSTSGNNNQNVSNLTPNPLNEDDSNLMNIPNGANLGAGQLLKAQLLLENNNKTCVRKGNEICDQTELCDEVEAKKKKGIIETKDCETVKCPICHEKIDKNVAKNINCVQCSTILHDQCFRENTLAYRQVQK